MEMVKDAYMCQPQIKQQKMQLWQHLCFGQGLEGEVGDNNPSKGLKEGAYFGQGVERLKGGLRIHPAVLIAANTKTIVERV